MALSRRVTVSLPPDTLGQLDFVAHRLRVTRSALLSVMLRESLPSLSELALSFPDPSDDLVTEADIRRFRGKSAHLIGDLLRELHDQPQGSGNDNH